MWIKLTGSGEDKETLLKAGQRLSELLGVSVEIDAYPYGYEVKAKETKATCDCGGVGGHSNWCKSQTC